MLGSGGTGGSGSGDGGGRGEKRRLPLPKARGSVMELAAARSKFAAKSVATAQVRTGDPVVSMMDGADMVVFAKAPPSARSGGGVG